MWVFGYGSLIWKVGFDFEERREGYVEGWTRRFWQESTDHRGTPRAPGRVVTLIEEAGARCWGAAYRVQLSAMHDVLDRLDYREKGGYVRHQVAVRDRVGPIADAAVMYVGTPGNPNWGGPLPIHEIADIIATAEGPSGANLEYAANLHRVLKAAGAEDTHVQEVYERLMSMGLLE